jgi:hypothetical protein
MPNWCWNDVTITHDNSKVIERFVQGFNKGALFAEFIPCPIRRDKPDLSKFNLPRWEREFSEAMICSSEILDWSCDNWGTKWDTGKPQGDTLEIINPNRIHLIFATAWGHPIPIFDHWVDSGCQVRAEFSGSFSPVDAIYEDKIIKQLKEGGEGWEIVHLEKSRIDYSKFGLTSPASAEKGNQTE